MLYLVVHVQLSGENSGECEWFKKMTTQQDVLGNSINFEHVLYGRMQNFAAKNASGILNVNITCIFKQHQHA